MSKKCLILIDSFKGSKNASSKELGKFLSSFLNESIYLPISDGGDGFLDFIDAIKSSKKIQIKTFSPLKDEININILLDENNNAYFESKDVINYSYKEKGNIFTRLSYGIGEVLKTLNSFHIKNLFIGLGGSSTSDCGIGMLIALGVKFYKENKEVKINSVKDILNVNKVNFDSFEKLNYKISLISDVDNPLTGKNGANCVFAKQKGASNNDILILEECFIHFKNLLKENLINLNDEVGEGAAGGISFILKHLLKAEYFQGSEFALSLINYNEIKNNFDFIITGEGSFDEQSFHKKIVGQILNLTDKNKVIILTGQNKTSYKTNLYSIMDDLKVDEQEAMTNTHKYLKDLIRKVKNDFSLD